MSNVRRAASGILSKEPCKNGRQENTSAALDGGGRGRLHNKAREITLHTFPAIVNELLLEVQCERTVPRSGIDIIAYLQNTVETKWACGRVVRQPSLALMQSGVDERQEAGRCLRVRQ